MRKSVYKVSAILVVFIIVLYIAVINYYLNKYYSMLENPDMTKEAYMFFLANKDKTNNYLNRKLKNEKKIMTKYNIIILLGEAKCYDCEDTLVGLLANNDWRTRYLALDSLANIDSNKFDKLLIELINDKNQNERLRSRAVILLGEKGGKASLDFLKKLLVDLSENDSTMLKIAINNAISLIQVE